MLENKLEIKVQMTNPGNSSDLEDRNIIAKTTPRLSQSRIMCKEMDLGHIQPQKLTNVRRIV